MCKPLVVFSLAVALIGCSGEFPRDPDRTSARMRGGVIQVGISHDPPHVVVPMSGAPSGSDVARILALARRHGARVHWVRGDHEGLMRDLQARRLQAVIGGVHADSPWGPHVGLSREFDAVDAEGRTIRRVIAMPPGENAWLMSLDTLLLEADR